MKKNRISTLPLLVVVAVVALLVGSVGAATAGSLNKGKVKKIAAKVVHKQAPTLSVANAANLNGQPASAYQTQGYRFRLPATPATSLKTWTFNLPPGNYLVSYSLIASTTVATAGLGCSLWTPPGSSSSGTEARDYGSPRGFGYSTSSGSAVLQVANGPVSLQCFTDSGTFTVNPDAVTVSNVSAVKLDTLATGTLTRGTDGAAHAPAGTSGG